MLHIHFKGLGCLLSHDVFNEFNFVLDHLGTKAVSKLWLARRTSTRVCHGWHDGFIPTDPSIMLNKIDVVGNS